MRKRTTAWSIAAVITFALTTSAYGNGAVSAAAAALAARVGIQALLTAFKALTGNNDAAVWAAAVTPDGQEIKSDGPKQTLFTVTVDAEKNTANGHAKTHSEANADFFSFDQDHVKVDATVPRATGYAAGWARADARMEFDELGLGGASLESTALQLPTHFDALLTADLDIVLQPQPGIPAVAAFSLSDLSATAIDKHLLDAMLAFDYLAVGVDPAEIYSSGFSDLESTVTPQVPLNPYMFIVASFDQTNPLQVTAIDHLGNTLLSPADFLIEVVDGVSTASFTGRVSTTVSVNFEEPFQLHAEDYGSAAAVAAVPEPSILALFACGALGLAYTRRRMSNRSRQS